MACMGQTTITVKEETLERFNDTKKTPEGEVEPSADLFLKSLLDAWEAAEEGYYDEPELHVDHELADQIKEQLENYQPEVDLDELEDRIVVRIAREKEADIATVEQNILNRLDDLQSQLPNDVAGELR